MAKAAIIVESPTKTKTLSGFLGKDYVLLASMGHVRDLPEKDLAVDVEHDFQPEYVTIPRQKKTITKLKQDLKGVDEVYLASDPDREGEAIAWHIAEEIKAKGKPVQRVLFNDLTKSTVLEALNHPRDLDVNKFDAQQTRRTLDRLVGYQISPILWDKVRRGLSAGRVQSVAVRLICEREEEIRNFVKEEYWTITALLEGKNPPPFEARLVRIAGKKAKILNEAQSRDILRKLDAVPFIVSAIEKKETRKSPPPPFTTSKLQQEAARWFRFSPKKTMRIAQKLYEGIELGKEGPVGLITYMRTDSVRIADEALRDARKFIDDNYGKDYLPPKARFFAKSGRTQDAHEAIRPASLAYRPSDIRKYLGNDEFRLYQLIWNRFVACQMNPAVFDQTTIDITAGSCLFRAQGSVMKFAGFTIVYTEGKDNDDENGIGKTLPEVTEKELLKLLSLTPEQHFTQPPPRFSEATLVKELEEKGIGRPSTYAAILSTIQDREYVRLENGRLFPTELGTLVNEQLVKNFPKILDVEFTAMMENQLDRIEEGTLERLATLKEFYVPFEKDLEKARKQMRNVKKEEIPTDIVCDKCGSPMVIKWGRKGQFIACSNYPKCKNTSNFTEDENGKIVQTETEKTDMVCEKCGKPMVVKEGRFGRFLGCSGYPECKSTAAISLGVSCPEKGCGGDITEKRTKKGKAFFGCSNYPKCKFATWDRPIPEPCPACGAPFLVEKYSRNKGRVKACIDKECGYRQAQE